jgi:hypothetical protein
MSSRNKSIREKAQGVISGAVVPMEHDPLRHCHNTVLRFIQRRQLCLESFVGERHDDHYRGDLRPQLFIGTQASELYRAQEVTPRSSRMRLKLQRGKLQSPKTMLQSLKLAKMVLLSSQCLPADLRKYNIDQDCRCLSIDMVRCHDCST